MRAILRPSLSSSKTANARLQGAIDRGHAQVQQAGDLGGAPAQDVSQDEHRALARRQQLEGPQESERDRLARVVSRLGSCRGSAQQLVRVRADAEALLAAPAALAAFDRIEAGVRRDAVEPGPERNIALKGGPPSPGVGQGVLDRVFRVVDRTQHPVAVDEQLAPVRVHQLAERLGGSADERLLVSG
jgi:hypothetical protein